MSELIRIVEEQEVLKAMKEEDLKNGDLSPEDTAAYQELGSSLEDERKFENEKGKAAIKAAEVQILNTLEESTEHWTKPKS